MTRMTELAAEDAKLVTLARAARARTSAEEGAAVRDGDGRTYAAATVDLPSFQASALQVCVAMAVSSGTCALEAAVVVTDSSAAAEADLATLRDFAGSGVVFHRANTRGNLLETLAS